MFSGLQGFRASGWRDEGTRLQGTGIKGVGLSARVQGSKISRCRVRGSGFGVRGLGFMSRGYVEGQGLGAHDFEFRLSDSFLFVRIHFDLF